MNLGEAHKTPRHMANRHGKGAAPEDKHKISKLRTPLAVDEPRQARWRSAPREHEEAGGANGNGAQGDPKAAAQVQGMMMQAQTKAKILADTAA